ncbi:cardiolipin synthase [Candidatus Pandoraea novymonadis]|uniref:Cardiolipin synthase n=1 Tax=Candidatus Pandoraea novymonadis TaxID=1808959 RepID=A0ABX5FEA5_9BURK|nr:cardiolipin synthase [Candidatus Pandoraea novymonadis]PSB92046.1 putative cardiolipin synthase YwiE [Candidatus Pandoraea novymonadis]
MTFSWIDIGFGIGVLHVIGIMAAIHAVMTVRTSQGSIAWAVSLTTIPYFTLIPYLFLGRSTFLGYVEARRACNQLMRSQFGEIISTGPSPPLAANIHPEFRALTTLTNMPFVAGNHVKLLINGHATFNAIFEAIGRARDYVIIQFFIIRDDKIGHELQQHLLSCAAAGVKVYFLYDRIGSYDLPRRYCEILMAGGVIVREFSAARRGLFINRFQLNFRNHRKIVVIDGIEAFVGGHNVGNEYLGEKFPLAPWRDTHISVTGPAVIGIQHTFAEDWHWSTGTVPLLNQTSLSMDSEMHCQVVPSGPSDQLETSSLFFVSVINAARERVWLTSPYFCPDEAVFTALRLAVLRGVEVRILIPSCADHRMVYEATQSYAHEAVRSGIKIYRYRHGFLHQKVVLIDDTAAAIGSANLDNRSFRLNFELMILTVDKHFAAEVSHMLMNDFSNSEIIERESFLFIAGWRRMLMRIARMFAPIL